LINKGDPEADVLLKEQAKHKVDKSKERVIKKLTITDK